MLKLKTKKFAGLFLLIALVFAGNFAQAQNETVKVTIIKYVDGAKATATSAASSNFAVNANWDSANLGGAGSGQFNLSASGYNGDPTPYQAVTTSMSSGASYSISEVKDGTIVGASCSTYSSTSKPKFALAGYSYGDTLAAAAAATKSITPPNLTNITTNKYIIVWNKTCKTNENTGNNGNGKLKGTVTGGQNSESGNLKVDSVVVDDGSAIADGTFTNGLKYTFNITIPTNETHLSMKFADWTRNGGGGIIPVANNLRISSPQADNSGATVLLTAANTYSSPTLNMITDLDPSMEGIQVKVKVELAVPATTPNGNYTTTYGIKTI